MARYTLIQSGDFNAAENVGALAGDIKREGIVDGLELSNFDTAAPSIDVAAGKTVHIVSTQVAEATLDDGTTVSEQRDQVQLVAHVDSQTVSLTDGTVNELFLGPQVNTDDSPRIEVVTSGTPSSNAVKIGEVDTSADTVSGQFNKIEPDGTLSFPDAGAASAALSSLPAGVGVINRASSELIYDDALSAAGLQATQFITDPEGNTVTSLSDPVLVTEEAVTFTESDVTVVSNGTSISRGGIKLIDPVIDGFEDGDRTVEDPDWNGWFGDTGFLSAQQTTVITGSTSGELAANNASNSVYTNKDSATTQKAKISLQISADNGGSDTVNLIFNQRTADNSTGGRVVRIVFNDSGPIINEGDSTNIRSSWSVGKTYTFEVNFDFANDQFELILNGANEGTFDFVNSASDWGQHVINNTTTLTGSSRSVFIDDVSEGTATTSGDALVKFDSGVPADIDSYDLATFQRTTDGETVSIDIEDSNGNVLKSDIAKDTDISSIATTTDVQLRANLSRNDTSNNPTLDYAARRFTR